MENEKMVGRNYEKEYAEAMKRLEKADAENRHLRDELKLKDKELSWYHGFKTAVELIFGKGYGNV